MSDTLLALLVAIRGVAFGVGAWLMWRFMRRSEFKAICLASVYLKATVAGLAAVRALFLVWTPPEWLLNGSDLAGTALVVMVVLFLSREVDRP